MYKTSFARHALGLGAFRIARIVRNSFGKNNFVILVAFGDNSSHMDFQDQNFHARSFFYGESRSVDDNNRFIRIVIDLCSAPRGIFIDYDIVVIIPPSFILWYFCRSGVLRSQYIKSDRRQREG